MTLENTRLFWRQHKTQNTTHTDTTTNKMSHATVEGRGCNSRLGVSLETHVKIWYQKLKLKLSYEQLKTEKPIK